MDIPPTDVPDRKANLEQVVSAKQHLERTLRAMDGLTCTHRLALAYRGAGEGYPEIARRLGMSAENARKVVQVARGALRGAANDVAT
jgi:DNA-directed RNA polymerase specialized sigma24 family protein